MNTDGQLYTIEGFAAGLIMLMTAYLVVNATSVYTAGDTHISDMQLEALGSDALTMMGTNVSLLTMSPLESTLEYVIDTGNVPNATFKAVFLNLTNNRTGVTMDYSKIDSTMDYIHFNASYTCRNIINNISETHPISYSRNLTGGEHTVRATKWVIVNRAVCGTLDKPRAVLVEVLLWRD